ncbi:Acetyltransferase (GNAT) family protein [Actinacidiphila alni]|uniref:Acetyltransferase (GNAT) family protein n=1 Tax=Actinacidiphila alni TaxID=380248 RepID=A0A1I2LTS4_9ACTN|nr:GNAT family N-acetyltransferase [Actinacidiphila alni]SFF81800.1 Acetyltransferase (GNAT) family protein [Actinacidiphila alni]
MTDDQLPARTLRPAEPRDLAAVADLLALAGASDNRRETLERLTDTASGSLRYAWVAERAGRIVGAAKLTSHLLFPGTLSAMVAVAEPERRAGTGGALAALIEQRLATVEGYGTVTCSLRDDSADGRRFAEARGFTAHHHSKGWRLPLAALGDGLPRLAARAADDSGVRIRLVTDSRAEAATIMECVGRTMESLPIPAQEGQEVDMSRAGELIGDDAVTLLAETVEGTAARVRGLTMVTPERDGRWSTVYTGVEPDYRRRGVARAVKLAAFAYLAERGASEVVTHNDSGNAGILGLNASFAMEPGVGYWTLSRRIDG